MPTTAARRPLTFTTLDQVMPDVDRLMAGHTTVGKWTLGQICKHLTIGLTVSVDGPEARAPWLVRKLVAPVVLRRVLSRGKMGEGVKVPAALLPRPGLDDRAEVEALRAALRAFAAHTGPMAEHPFFGALGRDRHERFHCIHCAHHLSFALPTT